MLVLPLWVAVGAVVLLAGEAALQGSALWLGGAGVSALALAGALLRRDGRAGRLPALAVAALAATLLAAGWRAFAQARDAEEVARATAADATEARDRLLATAVASARRTATLALNRPGTAASLGDLVSGRKVEQGLVILAGDTIIAVAGPHRLPPAAGAAPFQLAITPFVKVLTVREVRNGREAQVALLLDAAPGVPAAGPSLAREATGWRAAAWSWPRGDTILRYTTADAAIAGVRDAMRASGPAPEVAVARDGRLARQTVSVALGLVAVILLLSSAEPAGRAAALLFPMWAISRLGVAPQFLPPTATRALLAAVALLLLAIVLWRRPARRSPVGVLAALLLVGTTPLLAVVVARQVVPALEATSLLTWFAWQLTMALATMGYLAVASAPLRTTDDAARSSRWGLAAAALMLVAGVVGIVAWTPAHGWAPWFLPCLAVPLACFLAPTHTRARLAAIAAIGATLAALATWGASLDRRVQLATDDMNRLARGHDGVAVAALDAFAADVDAAHATRLDQLYATWRGSELARVGAPVHLALWSAAGDRRESVALDSLNVSWNDLRQVIVAAAGRLHRDSLARDVGHHEVLVVPLAPDTLATVTIGPRSRVIAPSRFGRMVGWRSPGDPAYQLAVSADNGDAVDYVFRRNGRFLRAERRVSAGGTPLLVRASIEMATPRPFAVRAALVVLLDMIAFAAVWALLQRVLGQPAALTAPVLRRSYRRTLAATLAAFFIVPATLFTLYSILRLRGDAAQARVGEVTRTLRDVAVAGGFALAEQPAPLRDALAPIADSVDAELAIYRRGRLVTASASLLPELGLLPPVIDPRLHLNAGDESTTVIATSGAALRIGAEAVTPVTLVAAALPGGDRDLAREQIDLALLLLLTVLGGTVAAIAVAGLVANALGEPIGALRRTALAIGRREAPPAVTDVPAEFAPVFGAIRQMELDLRESEAELESGRARTAAILATVATGVIGVDATGAVIQANPRATELLGQPIRVGEPLADQLPDDWRAVRDGLSRLLGPMTRDAESRELDAGDRRLAVTLAPLGDGGLVLAITDITEASRAARIVAWGEMARQVAHEIKNPLTPMRLGLQHLRRVRADGNPDLPRIVDDTAERLLGEIERLDRIARSFARYGAPPERDAAPAEPIALRRTIDELAALFAVGGDGLRIDVEGDPGALVLARPEELVQVLLNLVENARQAGATRVRFIAGPDRLEVIDDGQGIPPDQIGRIFEPTFSTTTSGTGLGLAIVRRLVEGWGGSIVAERTGGPGATFTIRFASTSSQGGA